MTAKINFFYSLVFYDIKHRSPFYFLLTKIIEACPNIANGFIVLVKKSFNNERI